jgi:hypothetical protein
MLVFPVFATHQPVLHTILGVSIFRIYSACRDLVGDPVRELPGVTHLESPLVHVLILKNFNLFRMNIGSVDILGTLRV